MPGGGDQTSTTSTEPPAYVKPYIIGGPGVTGVLPEAQKLFQGGNLAIGPYPGSTVAPMAPESELALGGIANRALQGSPLNAAAGGAVMDTLSGAYIPGGANAYTSANSGAASDYYNRVLGGEFLNQDNPYLQGIKDNAALTASQIAGNFSAGGGGGEHSFNESLGRGVADAMAPYLFDTYNTERGAQGQAAAGLASLGGQDTNQYLAERGFMGNAINAAPGLANTDYQDLQALLGVGAARQGQGQAELSDQVSRWLQAQGVPLQNIQNYASLIYGSPGSVTSSTQPGPSTLQQVFGGALGAGGLATGLGWAPFA